MVISSDAFSSTSSKLSEYLKSTDHPSMIEIQGMITNLLNRKDLYEKVKQFYANLHMNEVEFHKELSILKFSSPHEIIKDSNWLYIKTIGDSMPHTLWADRARITYVEFFTLEHASENESDWYNEILNFVKVLPKLYSELYLVGLRGHDSLTIRIPNNLFDFLLHSDTLAIYYKDPMSSVKIREIINSTMSKNNILLSRFLKSQSGFDIDDIITRTKFTYTDMISQILSDEIYHNKDKLKTLDMESFSKYLRDSVKAANKLSLPDVYRKII